MKKLFLINESEKQRILNFHTFSSKKQYLNIVTEDDKPGALVWLEDNNVKLSSWAFPNPFKPGVDLKIGVKSSIDFPEIQRKNDPDSQPYHYFRDWIMSNTSKLIIKNANNQVLLDDEVTGEDFNLREDDGYYITYPSDSDLVQNILKEKQIIIQFYTTNMSNALSPKFTFKPFRLIVEGNI